VFYRPVVEDDLGVGELHEVQYRHSATWSPSPPDVNFYSIANGEVRRVGSTDWVKGRLLLWPDGRAMLRGGLLDHSDVRL
jgi:hypothetical protein